MFWKLLAAVVAFLLVVAGFNYVGANVDRIIVLIVAFIGAYLAFKYTPTNPL